MAAVPGSDIGGPDWAPNQASAALSRSLVNQRSSRASPEPRKSTARSAPGVRGRPLEGHPSARTSGAGPRASVVVRTMRPPPGCGEPTPPRTAGRRRRLPARRPRRSTRRSRRGRRRRPAAARRVRRHRGRGGGEAPGVAVEVAQPVGGEVQVLDDAALPDDHVRARTAVDAHPGPPLDRGDRTTEDVVGLDHLDRQPGARQVAGRDQPVVAGADDDHVDGGVGRWRGHAQLFAGPGSRGCSGRRAPRMAKGRASPGKW